MRWIFRLLSSIAAWWRRSGRRHAFTGIARVESSIDPAVDISAGKLVLIGPEERPKWLRFACPCRCGEVLALNLMTSHRPHWSVELHEDGTMTVHPSVDAKSCGSHFWIRRSLIEWV